MAGLWRVLAHRRVSRTERAQEHGLLVLLALPCLLDVLLNGLHRQLWHLDSHLFWLDHHVAVTARQLGLTCKGAKDGLLACLDARLQRPAHLDLIVVHMITLLAKADESLVRDDVSLPRRGADLVRLSRQAVARISEASVALYGGLTRRDQCGVRVHFCRLLARDRQSGSLETATALVDHGHRPVMLLHRVILDA